MHLLDSNILIYSYLPDYHYLRTAILSEQTFISEISRIEVLGYHKITIAEEMYFKSIFKYANLILPDYQIIDKAVEIRKTYNLSLGDSLIASTAIVNSLTLYTANMADFNKINGLSCKNPVANY